MWNTEDTKQFPFVNFCSSLVLWCCWFGNKKSIRSVKRTFGTDSLKLTLYVRLNLESRWNHGPVKQKRLKPSIALCGNPSQSFGTSLAIWDHRVLPVTRQEWTHPALTPANQAGTRFTYPGVMEGWVDQGSLDSQQGIKPTTAWSQVRRPNRYATKPP